MPRTTESFEEWLARVDAQPLGTLRRGQNLYNQLVAAGRHNLASRATSRHTTDPFYVDARIPDFLRFVRAHWDEP